MTKSNSLEKRRERALLLGLAVGDALGVPAEFKRRGSFRVDDMTGYGSHNQPPGTWSDDTSLALALADNLGEGGLSLENLAKSFVAWYDEGKFTPYGEVFDVGGATSRAIERLKRGVAPAEAGGRGERDNGNGSLMRIAPLVFYTRDKTPLERFEITKLVSSLTHAHPVSVIACFIYMETLDLLLGGLAKDKAYAELRERFKEYRTFLNIPGRFERILNGDIASLPESEIQSGGYVVDTLEASLWAFLNGANYRDATLKAVNLGDDTDTTGAVTGALAGAYYGEEDIPEKWLNLLAKRDEIVAIANGIVAR